MENAGEETKKKEKKPRSLKQIESMAAFNAFSKINLAKV
jgi:hypothetical protein